MMAGRAADPSLDISYDALPATVHRSTGSSISRNTSRRSSAPTAVTPPAPAATTTISGTTRCRRDWTCADALRYRARQVLRVADGRRAGARPRIPVCRSCACATAERRLEIVREPPLVRTGGSQRQRAQFAPDGEAARAPLRNRPFAVAADRRPSRHAQRRRSCACWPSGSISAASTTTTPSTTTIRRLQGARSDRCAAACRACPSALFDGNGPPGADAAAPAATSRSATPARRRRRTIRSTRLPLNALRAHRQPRRRLQHFRVDGRQRLRAGANYAAAAAELDRARSAAPAHRRRPGRPRLGRSGAGAGGAEWLAIRDWIAAGQLRHLSTKHAQHRVSSAGTSSRMALLGACGGASRTAGGRRDGGTLCIADLRTASTRSSMR
jgi:hypothetical protein